MSNLHPNAAAQIVVELCKRFPKASNYALAKRLQNENPARFPTFNVASCAVRHYRGKRGKPSQTAARIHVVPLSKPHVESCDPFELDARRILILGDLQIPYFSKIAVEAALRFGERFKPDAIFINGDLFDFCQISHFDKDPDLPSVKDELLAGGRFFDHITARFPKAKRFYKKGNHDERWERYIFNVAPAITDVPGIKDGWAEPAGILRNNVTVIGDKRPVMLGKLPVLHGHELGGRGGGVNPARWAFTKTNHTVLVHHFHRTSNHGDGDMFHKEMCAWSVGCLCGLSPPFMPINKWNHGFATVEVYKDGGFDVNNLRIGMSGKVRAS